MFVITKNNHYYAPSVVYRTTLDEARAVAAEFASEMFSEHGKHECRIMIAEVIEEVVGKSNY